MKVNEMIIIFSCLVKLCEEKKEKYFYCYQIKNKDIINKKENKN